MEILAMNRKKPPILRYVCLAILFTLASGYEIRSTLFSFPDYFNVKAADYPFYPIYVNGRPLAQLVAPAGQRGGVKENDVILAVNGRRLTGRAVFGEAIRRSQPADLMAVEVLTPGDASSRVAKIVLQQRTAPRVSWALASVLALKVVVPTFCILLGFWVVFVRPRDPSAWFLCFIMLFFSVYYGSGVESWGPVVRDIGTLYQVTLGNAWPIFMLLFGISFPEPFPGKEPAWWKWSWQSAVLTLIAFTILNVTVALGQLENFAAVASFTSLDNALGRVEFFLSFASIAAFFICISFKMQKAVTPDAKRRLKLLYVGSCISMTPVAFFLLPKLSKEVSSNNCSRNGLFCSASA